MAKANPNRHIIATTIDTAGVSATQTLVMEQGFGKQIEVREEDGTRPLPYSDGKFDYIYARLVLHYLTKQQLEGALGELHRVLRADGMLFIVVRSAKNIDAKKNITNYDEETGMTTYISRPNKDITEERRRFFHTVESLSQFITNAGFHIKSTSEYDEKLFHGYARTVTVDHSDNLIELVAIKTDS